MDLPELVSATVDERDRLLSEARRQSDALAIVSGKRRRTTSDEEPPSQPPLLRRLGQALLSGSPAP